MNAAVKRLDVICIGRVAVDLYAQQIGSRLEDVASFAKYLGGSSGNVAFGTAIQGLKSAMLARVGDEHNGRFLRETLNRAGVDTEYLITDKSRLTALVMLGIKDQEMTIGRSRPALPGCGPLCAGGTCRSRSPLL